MSGNVSILITFWVQLNNNSLDTIVVLTLTRISNSLNTSWAKYGTLQISAFIAFHEYYDTSASLQFPAMISFTKAVDIYYKSTKTDLHTDT